MMAQAPYTPKAQEGRNKSIVDRYFREVLDGGRVELMRELFTHDAVLHRPGLDVRGVEAAMQRLRAVLDDYCEFSTELSGLIAEGDLVAVRVRHRTKTRPGAVLRSRAGEVLLPAARVLEWTAIVQFRLQDGRIAEEWVMRDELGMLAQAGRVSFSA